MKMPQITQFLNIIFNYQRLWYYNPTQGSAPRQDRVPGHFSIPGFELTWDPGIRKSILVLELGPRINPGPDVIVD